MGNFLNKKPKYITRRNQLKRYMYKKKSNKVILIIMLIFTLLSIIPLCQSYGANNNNIGSKLKILSVGNVEYHLKSHNVSSGGYVITALAGYYDKENFYPAYCMNRNLHGADDNTRYDVTITEIVKDTETYNKVWRVITSGYPYQSLKKLEMPDWTYAYQATKMAVYCVTGQADVNEYYATDEIGQAIVNLIHKLVQIGENGKETYKTSLINIQAIGNLQESDNYYIQNYKINSNIKIENYKIEISNFPLKTKITNTKGEEKSTFNVGENFQIKIPKNEFETKDINGKISANVATEENAIFYAESYNSKLQDYTVTGEKISISKADINFNTKVNTAGIKIKKVDEETNKGISNTTFQLCKEDGTIISTATTNSNGEIIFNNLYQDEYIIKEIKSNDNYELKKETIKISAKYNKIIEQIVTNKHKTGDVKIYKVDKDNRKITIKGVEFELYNKELNKVLGVYKTNEKGEIHITELRTGEYKLHEIKTDKWYELGKDVNIVVKWNETSNITIENEHKKGQIKVIKVDKNNNKIKLEGVTFKIYDEENNEVETLITNKNGEAVTKKLPIGKKYTIKEISTNSMYELTKETQVIELEKSEIKTITIENEHKKGQIKVVKVDKDNNEIKLEGVTFKIYDEENNEVETLITNKNGEAVTKKLPIGKKYTIKEISTNSMYELTKETQVIELEKSEIKTITIENEHKKGQIKVIKVDKDNKEIKLKGVKFEILDKEGKIVDRLITDTNGEAISKKLKINDIYAIKETETQKNYILSEQMLKIILKENQIKTTTIKNEKIETKVNIEKSGPNIAKEEEEIKYEFKVLKNNSNVKLQEFTWRDILPYNSIKILKLMTGVYNEKLEYIVKYKTNKSNEYVTIGKYSTQQNNEIDFSKINLNENEYIEDFKVEFGTVSKDFKAVQGPILIAKVLKKLNNINEWINKTTLVGKYNMRIIEDKSEWKTQLQEKIDIIPVEEKKELPKTGY